MLERTVSHRQQKSSTRRRALPATRHPLAVLTIATVLGLAGCHGNNGTDPADVNAAQAETTCPANQVLMSDGSCADASQAGAVPQNAPASPANQQQAYPRAASAPSYASGSASRSAGRQPQYGTAGDDSNQPQEAQSSVSPQEEDSAPASDSDPYYTQNAYDNQSYQQDAYNDGYQQGYEQGVQASQPPPPLPVYAQPECPGDGYLWNPGYWNYANAGYYWVPGVWVRAPYTGALWTPGWWGFLGGLYRWHHGYWGSHIGFYGGIPYGYGYTGSGFHGGYWNQDRFMYNRSVTNIRIVNIRNTYNRTVINNVTVNNRVSYNGGRGGLNVRPTQGEFAAMREQHVRPLPAQVEHRTQAMQNRQQYASFNGGRPANVIAARPLQLQRINVTPRVVNPGVRGETRPAPAMPRQTPNAGRPVQQQPGVAARPAQPAIQPAHTAPTRAQQTNGERPTVEPNRALPNQPAANHTQPVRMQNPQADGRANPPTNVRTQPAQQPAPGNRVVARPQSPTTQTPAAAPQHTVPRQDGQQRPVEAQRPNQSRPTSQPSQPRTAPQVQHTQPTMQQERPQQPRTQEHPQMQRPEQPRMQEQKPQEPRTQAPRPEAPHSEAPHGDHGPHP